MNMYFSHIIHMSVVRNSFQTNPDNFGKFRTEFCCNGNKIVYWWRHIWSGFATLDQLDTIAHPVRRIKKRRNVP